MTDVTGEPRHVFVDPTGRRARVLHRATWLATVTVLLALGVLVLALVAPPRLTRLLIPGLGDLLPGAAAPRLQTGSDGSGTPHQVLPEPTTLPSAVSTSGAPRSPSPSPTTGVPSPVVSRPPAVPSPTPAATPPGQAATPPGQPRPTVAPTPQGQGKPTARPTPRGGKPTASSGP